MDPVQVLLIDLKVLYIHMLYVFKQIIMNNMLCTLLYTKVFAYIYLQSVFYWPGGHGACGPRVWVGVCHPPH